MRWIVIFTLLLVGAASAQNQPPAPPDPFILNDTHPYTATYYKDTKGLTPRQITINPAQKTIILMVAGQSNMTTLLPTLYTPLNPTKVSQMNIYDGAFYPISGPVMGTNYSLGPGNLTVRVADTLIGMGGLDQVLLINVAMDGAQISDYGSTGALYDRGNVAMKRLAARGITPSTPGVFFVFLWGQGENGNDTVQATYATALADIKAKMLASGFSGRFFINLETWVAGATKSAIRAAQSGFVDGATVFQGGDLDTLNATNRQADNIHFNDTGGAAAALLIYNAIIATGY